MVFWPKQRGNKAACHYSVNHHSLVIALLLLFNMTTITMAFLSSVKSRLPSSRYYYYTHSPKSARFSTLENIDNDYKYTAIIAVGSNLGDRYENIAQGLQQLLSNNCRLVKTSFLYKTAPMYVTDQPWFLNGALQIYTNQPPVQLLNTLKDIEAALGRQKQAIRNGPRPIDLDICLYSQVNTDGSWNVMNVDTTTTTARNANDIRDLIIPHPRINEREFVLRPILDIIAYNNTDAFSQYVKQYQQCLLKLQSTAVRVIPLPRGRFLEFSHAIPLIMGILNVTPDSFSDGGKYNSSMDTAMDQVQSMIDNHVDIIDIGGESTRPGADIISIQQELDRVIPVICAIRQKYDNVIISIDTRRAAVAKAAIQAGADICNDVSGGTFDPAILSTVASNGNVPIVLMHCRNTTPQNMQQHTQYDNIVKEVTASLLDLSASASRVGIYQWMQILDVGVGFAKDQQGNLSLLKHYNEIRRETNNHPLLLGTSRKGFLGKIAGVNVAADRDYATIASLIATLGTCGSYETESSSSSSILYPQCDIVRVHNTAATYQALSVMAAIAKV